MKKDSGFQVIAPDRKKHAEAIFDLLAKVFSQGHGYYPFYEYCRRIIPASPHFDWGTTRVGFLDGKLVTYYGIYKYTMRIGSARVLVGGVGGVATDARYRKRGLVARAAAASIEAMRAGGYDLSHLFGIRNFYYRFGYVRSWEPTAYIVNRDELPREGPPLTLQRFEPRHRDDLARLYNRENARITGTAVRPTYQVRLAYSLARFQGYEWRDGAGRVSGYVVLAPQENHVDVIDFAGPVEQVLRALGVLARRLERREVRFGGLSWEHPLCKRLRRGYCRSEISHAGNAGPLASLVNLPSALRKLSSEMSGLLKASHLADWRGELLIGGSREKATLAINRARVSVEPPRPSKHRLIGGDEVVRLLLGSAEPEEIIEAARMRLSGDARALCAILFPNRRPMLSPWDGY